MAVLCLLTSAIAVALFLGAIWASPCTDTTKFAWSGVVVLVFGGALACIRAAIPRKWDR